MHRCQMHCSHSHKSIVRSAIVLKGLFTVAEGTLEVVTGKGLLGSLQGRLQSHLWQQSASSRSGWVR